MRRGERGGVFARCFHPPPMGRRGNSRRKWLLCGVPNLPLTALLWRLGKMKGRGEDLFRCFPPSPLYFLPSPFQFDDHNLNFPGERETCESGQRACVPLKSVLDGLKVRLRYSRFPVLCQSLMKDGWNCACLKNPFVSKGFSGSLQRHSLQSVSASVRPSRC